MPESENKDRNAAIRGDDWLWAFCKSCGRSVRLEKQWSIAVASRELRRDALERYLKCAKCGARSAMVVWAERPLKK